MTDVRHGQTPKPKSHESSRQLKNWALKPLPFNPSGRFFGLSLSCLCIWLVLAFVKFPLVGKHLYLFAALRIHMSQLMHDSLDKFTGYVTTPRGETFVKVNKQQFLMTHEYAVIHKYYFLL